MKMTAKIMVIVCAILMTASLASALTLDFSSSSTYPYGSTAIVTDSVYSNTYGCIGIEWYYDSSNIIFYPVYAWYSSGCAGSGYTGGCYRDPVYGYICVN